MTRKKKTIEDASPVLLCVGTGGVFYHGISRMATFINRRGTMDVVLIDPDKVEAKNAARQWGLGADLPKVQIAGNALAGFIPRPVAEEAMIPASIDSDGDIIKYVEMAFPNTWKEVPYYVVVHLPDNHKCRMDVHNGCKILAQASDAPVLEITGGNTASDGWAYSCSHTPDGGCKADWEIRHPDIGQEALKEIEHAASPTPCADTGTIEQSVVGNTLTANGIWELAERAIQEEEYGEMYWSTQENGNVLLRYVQLVPVPVVEDEVPNE